MARVQEFVDSHPCPGYRVAPDGRIRYGKHPVSIEYLSNGVPYVNVRVMGRREPIPVEVLVAFAFIGPPPALRGWRVGYLNGDPTDIRAENLFWAEDEDYWDWYWRDLMRAPYHRPPKLPPELLGKLG